MRNTPRKVRSAPGRLAPKRGGGFTLIELVIVVIIIGILSAVLTFSMKSTTLNSPAGDIGTLKTALRELALRATSDLPEETWTLTATSSGAGLYHNGTLVKSYSLSGTTGSFSASFNQIGQLQSNGSIPNAIYIDTETGYIP